MTSSAVSRTPILDDTPEDRRVAVTQRLPNLSNYIASDVSAWAAEMIIVRDNEFWREAGAVSWEDYCTRIVGKPMDWIEWIVGGYEALRAGRKNLVEATVEERETARLEAVRRMEAAWQPPRRRR